MSSAIAKMPTAKNNASTSQLPAKSLKTFTRFPDLPTEIRLKIWNIHLKRPQIITLRSGCTFDENNVWKPTKIYFTARGNVEVVSLMQTNRESRAEAQKLYHQSRVSSVVQPAFINYAQDTLFLDINWRCSDIFFQETYDFRTYPHCKYGSKCNMTKFRFVVYRFKTLLGDTTFARADSIRELRMEMSETFFQHFNALEALTLIDEQRHIPELEDLAKAWEIYSVLYRENRGMNWAVPKKISVITEEDMNTRIQPSLIRRYTSTWESLGR